MHLFLLFLMAAQTNCTFTNSLPAISLLSFHGMSHSQPSSAKVVFEINWADSLFNRMVAQVKMELLESNVHGFPTVSPGYY